MDDTVLLMFNGIQQCRRITLHSLSAAQSLGEYPLNDGREAHVIRNTATTTIYALQDTSITADDTATRCRIYYALQQDMTVCQHTTTSKYLDSKPNCVTPIASHYLHLFTNSQVHIMPGIVRVNLCDFRSRFLQVSVSSIKVLNGNVE